LAIWIQIASSIYRKFIFSVASLDSIKTQYNMENRFPNQNYGVFNATQLLSVPESEGETMFIYFSYKLTMFFFFSESKFSFSIAFASR
jgi:hypothetical protein